MAKGRRAANLAGLAALGALGYAMYNRDRAAKTGGSGPTIVPTEYYAPSGQGAPAAPAVSAARDIEEHVFTGPFGEAGGEGRSVVAARDQANLPPADTGAQARFAPAQPAAVAQPRTAAAPAAASARVPMNDREHVFDAPMVPTRNPNISQEVSRRTGVKLNSRAGAGRSAGQGGFTAAELAAYQRAQQASSAKRSAPLTREERIAQIPTSGNRTVSGGERVSGNEFTRNLSNTLNATAGLSAPGFVGNMTQKQYNALAALRRQEEGLSAAEAAAAKQVARENKTLNPMAWMAGPKGMEKFKKGGAVKAKKMASGGASSASQRGDGIASRGKTKCKMY